MSRVDYSRFYLTGGSMIGYRLCCLDCDGPQDQLPWLTDEPTMDLGEMVTMADEHCKQEHPDGQPAVVEAPVTHWPPEPQRILPRSTFGGVLGYLEAL